MAAAATAWHAWRQQAGTTVLLGLATCFHREDATVTVFQTKHQELIAVASALCLSAAVPMVSCLLLLQVLASRSATVVGLTVGAAALIRCSPTVPIRSVRFPLLDLHQSVSPDHTRVETVNQGATLNIKAVHA